MKRAVDLSGVQKRDLEFFLTFKLSTTGFDFASILVLELGVVSNDWVYAHFADVGILIYDI